jgi:radical SAM superfamily enzyme YgiQ (UPF0313 family)
VDVLIGQAYYLRFDPALRAARQPYAPLGALYAAACVRECGYSVALFDAMLAESEDEWAEALDRHRPAVAVIYEDSFNYLSKMCLLRMREAALVMISSARVRGVPVMVGGSDASDHPEIYLRQGALAVIAGEGEATLVHAIGTIRSGVASLHNVPGLVLDRGGTVIRTPARSVARDLDAFPRPAWDLVDIERYRAIWTQAHGYFSMSIATTRGCPYHCNWCAKPIYGQRYAARSAASVADEVAWLQTTYRPDHLWITDDIFGLKPGWIEAFADEVRARDATIPFKCLMRADGVNEARTAALQRAGCRTVWIGAESGSQRVLDAMEKGTRVDQIEAATRLLRGAGIEVGWFLQFGYPGETMEDIDQTLAVVRRCRPDDVGISVSYPLPGTAFHDRVQSQLGDKRNWIDSADLAVMFRATYVPEFYRALHPLVHAWMRMQRAADMLRGRHARRCDAHGHRRESGTMAVLAGGLSAALRYPLLARRVRRLASEPQSVRPTLPLVPVLSPQAAAVPSDQGPLTC